METETEVVPATKTIADGNQSELKQLEDSIDQHVAPPGQTDTEMESATEARSSGEEPSPVTWKPTGSSGSLRWTKTTVPQPDRPDRSRSPAPKPNATHTSHVMGKRVLTEKIKKKMLDKEVPYKQIPPEHLHLYHKAEEKEWDSWLKNRSVAIRTGKEAQHLRETVHPSRIIRIRFVYRDKNASIRTPQVELLVNAKARLCAQAFKEPLAKEGLRKVDSSTVQRGGVMLFLQHKFY